MGGKVHALQNGTNTLISLQDPNAIENTAFPHHRKPFFAYAAVGFTGQLSKIIAITHGASPPHLSL